MKESLPVQQNYLDAVIKTAQYLASLTTHQDVWSEIGKVLVNFFGADLVAFGERRGDGEIIGHHWAFSDQVSSQRILGSEAKEAIAEVLESGFLTSQLVFTPDPLSVAFLPITQENQVTAVILVGHRMSQPLPKELLNVYLAVAGLVGTTATRLTSETEVRQHRQHLEKLVKERTAELEAFTYSVSHDLRAPLRAMEGFSQALLEDYADRLDPVGQDYARRIAAAARYMDILIQDLLAWSRLSRIEIELRPVVLEGVVQEALSLLTPEIQEKSAQVAVERPLPRLVGHHGTLVQVVGNLLSNGIKFVAPGVKPQVRVWAETPSTPLLEGGKGEVVRLWVEDNGIGIAPEHHELIFRMFERLHGVETYPGTGVGLAIVRKGVERLGGRVGVESEPGRGSRFWVELPRSKT